MKLQLLWMWWQTYAFCSLCVYSQSEISFSFFQCNSGCWISGDGLHDNICDCDDCSDEFAWTCDTCLFCGIRQGFLNDDVDLEACVKRGPCQLDTDDIDLPIDDIFDSSSSDSTDSSETSDTSDDSVHKSDDSQSSETSSSGTSDSNSFGNWFTSDYTFTWGYTFTCDSGCEVDEDFQNDGYCDCDDCSDEDDWNCSTCSSCPSGCQGYNHVHCNATLSDEDDDIKVPSTVAVGIGLFLICVWISIFGYLAQFDDACSCCSASTNSNQTITQSVAVYAIPQVQIVQPVITQPVVTQIVAAEMQPSNCGARAPDTDEGMNGYQD